MFSTLINHIDPLWVNCLAVTKLFLTLYISDVCCLEMRCDNLMLFGTHVNLNLFHIVNELKELCRVHKKNFQKAYTIKLFGKIISKLLFYRRDLLSN